MDTNSKADSFNVTMFFFIVVAGLLLFEIGFATTLYNSTYMTVFITNTAPQMIFANATPNPALPGQTITARVNVSDANGDTLLVNITYYNTTSGAESDLISLVLEGDFYTNNTFTLPATAPVGTWYFNTTISDGFTTTINMTTFTVNAVLSTRIDNSPIIFGNQTVGQTAQRAENGTYVAGVYSENINGFPLVLNNTGNVLANYSINGTYLVGQTDGSEIIGIGNVTWNVTITDSGTRAGKIGLTTAPAVIAAGIAASGAQNVYFWIDTPTGVTQQEYRGNISIETIG
ncbi:hypothetical protein JXB27_04590 [Candidatus Woesearchaeota archaeon]|nr:hypothetical protein [Candidatus Woesearchaeota archaeon]